jgi:hypothetical protein
MKNTIQVVGRYIVMFFKSAIIEVEHALEHMFNLILRKKQKVRLNRSYPRVPKSYRASRCIEKYRKYLCINRHR